MRRSVLSRSSARGVARSSTRSRMPSGRRFAKNQLTAIGSLGGGRGPVECRSSMSGRSPYWLRRSPIIPSAAAIASCVSRMSSSRLDVEAAPSEGCSSASMRSASPPSAAASAAASAASSSASRSSMNSTLATLTPSWSETERILTGRRPSSSRMKRPSGCGSHSTISASHAMGKSSIVRSSFTAIPSRRDPSMSRRTMRR
mmetsp:Transcript_3320/g.11926  ORF Transcript_3320/g.11926 Transcript_3320/m.11926 type:complete len:201 (-) Transcript_3320:441-1043(-)